MQNTNWLAIVASVVFAMALGFLWYGVLFLDSWMAGNGLVENGDTSMLKYGVEVAVSSTPMIINTFAMVAYALFMNWLITKTGDTTWLKGAKLGAALGLISYTGIALTNLFAANDYSLTRVDGGYTFLLFTVMGAIIGGWRKQ